MQYEQKIEITLPMPISVNKAYAWNGRIRYKSSDYKRFEQEVARVMVKLPKYTLTEDKWLHVAYYFYFPIYNKNWSHKKKDLGNYEKCLTDCLTHYIIWFKDENIRILQMEKIDDEVQKVVIVITEI